MSLEEPFVLLTAGPAATPALILPLFVVTGASGSGKSTIVSELQRRLPDCVVFDNDLLWGKMGDDMYQFHNNWIRIAYAVAQGERHTVICGTIMPWDLDKAEDQRLLGTVHFVNLHCNDKDREARLRARPAFRKTTDEFVEEHRQFASWLLDNADRAYDPPMVTIDTSHAKVPETAAAVAEIVDGVIKSAGAPARNPTPVEASAEDEE